MPSFNAKVIAMSDVRVPIEKEYDNPKRRPGGGNFKDLLASGGCLPAVGANPHSLMSSFVDEAFEDGKLDDNELAGMKVLASMAPAGRPAAPPDKTPCEDQTATSPATSPPAGECEPAHFKGEVAKALDRSKDWDSGEQMAADTAKRLVSASSEQQMAFLDELWALMCDDDIDESSEREGSQLDAFVDGLFASGSSPTDDPWPGGVNSGRDNVIREFLCKAMRDNKMSEQELAGLRALINGSPTEQPTRPDHPREDRPEPRPVIDRSTTQQQRVEANMDWLVRIGAISIDMGERIKANPMYRR
jgi:hypothetical protein